MGRWPLLCMVALTWLSSFQASDEPMAKAAREKALVCMRLLRHFSAVMADRKLGCLNIFLFVALCASLFVNFVLIALIFQRLGGVAGEEEPIARFRETVLQRGSRGSSDKIAGILLRSEEHTSELQSRFGIPH